MVSNEERKQCEGRSLKFTDEKHFSTRMLGLTIYPNPGTICDVLARFVIALLSAPAFHKFPSHLNRQADTLCFFIAANCKRWFSCLPPSQGMLPITLLYWKTVSRPDSRLPIVLRLEINVHEPEIAFDYGSIIGGLIDIVYVESCSKLFPLKCGLAGYAGIYFVRERDDFCIY